jgi:type I restriction enzyme, R subunit
LRLVVEDTGDARLPCAYAPELYREKCSAVFEHVYESHPGRGVEVCATAP